MKKILSLTCLLAVGSCMSMSDAGCSTYGLQRPGMPTLGTDPVSSWVDVLDGAMTAACT